MSEERNEEIRLRFGMASFLSSDTQYNRGVAESDFITPVTSIRIYIYGY